jgi:hypothetical protein
LGGLDDVEEKIETAGCVEIRINEYEAFDRGTHMKPDMSATPKQTAVPETDKTRQIKVCKEASKRSWVSLNGLHKKHLCAVVDDC